ncbi:MAG: pseudouridine synthase [Prevotellaceae bacterium]|jgi:23S rRNA pseudouridine2605 synthase|nr:pseudouridine synthase [Prevotellaceae bacterium]
MENNQDGLGTYRSRTGRVDKEATAEKKSSSEDQPAEHKPRQAEVSEDRPVRKSSPKSFFTLRHEEESKNSERAAEPRDDEPAERKPRSRSAYSEEKPERAPRRKFDDEAPKRRSYSSDSYGDKPTRTFRYKSDDARGDDRPKRKFDGDKPYRAYSEGRPKRSFDGDRPRRTFGDDRPKRSFDGGDRSRRPAYGEDRPKRPFNGDKPRRTFGDDHPKRSFDNNDRPKRTYGEDRPARRSATDKPSATGGYKARPYIKVYEKKEVDNRPTFEKVRKSKVEKVDPSAPVRLNKFIANSGICSRREADVYIQNGEITVNGNVITELGTKILPTDEVKFHDRRLSGEKKVYLILNKPKGYVTTMDDLHAKRTVMDLIEGACRERIYPVGRLDRDTTGVLLFTNDGELTKTLTHPSYNKRKVYHVFLDKNVSRNDLEQLVKGVELEDGLAQADEVSYVDESNDKSELGLEIHSGRNRVVRRIFEALGYEVKRLDRVYFAGLTKKSLERGKWRMLTPKEVSMLKMGAYE